MQGEPAIEVRGLVKRFGPKTVLDGIDLTIQDNEVVCLMGSSGGGKSTLLRCISGLVPPTQGAVKVDGIDVAAQPEEARRHLGMVFQNAALFDYLSVGENILFGVRRWHQPTRAEEQEILEAVLDRVGLAGSANLMPSELSGGMRKRVGIARAVALKPDIMLYDEPTTGLDPITTYTIDRLILDLRKELGMTSVVVSHDVSSVVRTADRVVFLEAGKLTFEGSPEGFLASDRPAIRELVDKASARELV